MSDPIRTPDDYAEMASEFESGGYETIGPVTVFPERRNGNVRKDDTPASRAHIRCTEHGA